MDAIILGRAAECLFPQAAEIPLSDRPHTQLAGGKAELIWRPKVPQNTPAFAPAEGVTYRRDGGHRHTLVHHWLHG